MLIIYLTLIIAFMTSLFQKHTKVEDPNLKRVREDLQNRVDILKKQADVSCVSVSVCYKTSTMKMVDR